MIERLARRADEMRAQEPVKLDSPFGRSAEELKKWGCRGAVLGVDTVFSAGGDQPGRGEVMCSNRCGQKACPPQPGQVLDPFADPLCYLCGLDNQMLECDNEEEVPIKPISRTNTDFSVHSSCGPYARISTPSLHRYNTFDGVVAGVRHACSALNNTNLNELRARIERDPTCLLRMTLTELDKIPTHIRRAGRVSSWPCMEELKCEGELRRDGKLDRIMPVPRMDGVDMVDWTNDAELRCWCGCGCLYRSECANLCRAAEEFYWNAPAPDMPVAHPGPEFHPVPETGLGVVSLPTHNRPEPIVIRGLEESDLTTDDTDSDPSSPSSCASFAPSVFSAVPRSDNSGPSSVASVSPWQTPKVASVSHVQAEFYPQSVPEEQQVVDGYQPACWTQTSAVGPTVSSMPQWQTEHMVPMMQYQPVWHYPQPVPHAPPMRKVHQERPWVRIPALKMFPFDDPVTYVDRMVPFVEDQELKDGAGLFNQKYDLLSGDENAERILTFLDI